MIQRPGQDIPCSWTGRVHIVKMAIPPRAIYRFNVVPVRLPMTYFYWTGTNNSRICWNYWYKGFWITKAILSKKNRAEGRYQLPRLQTMTKVQQSRKRFIGTKTDIRSMQQNREPRNKPIRLWSISLQWKRQRYTVTKRPSISSVSDAEKTGQLPVKEWD